MLPILLFSAMTLADQAAIRRDSYGVPHILARSEEAASYALGYAQAEDHAVEIAKRFMGARGRSHEIGGKIEDDFRVLQFHNVEESERAYKALPPLYKMLVASYIAGVNRYIETHRAKLPAWIPVFTGADVLALTRSGGLAGISSAAMAPDLNREGDLYENEAGSNAFALHGARTKSGAPILVGNPHLGWGSLYWEAHVKVPGKIDFFGSTLPGIPVLRAGFNSRLGWVNTNNSPDLVDVFVFKALDGDRYEYDGKAMPLTRHTVKIADQSRDYWDSQLGPVIRRTKEKVYVVRSAGLDAIRYYEGFYRLARTKSLKEFKQVMELGLIPFSHFTYADADGNIFYAWNARLPRRLEDGAEYTRPVPGEPKYIWKDFYTFKEFPQLTNPKGGYIANSNDAPWYTNLRGGLDPAKFPKTFERGDLRLRQASILEILHPSDAKYSLEEAWGIKHTNKVLLADRLKNDLVKAAKAAGDPDLGRAAEILEKWDGAVNAESRGAVLFLNFAAPYLKSKNPFAEKFEATRPLETPRGLGDPAFALQCLREALKLTKSKYGDEAIAYGEVNRFRCLGKDLPGDGAMGTYGVYRVLGFEPQPDGKNAAGFLSAKRGHAGFGDAWILGVEFTKPLRAFSVVSYGQSSDPQSKHACDQIELFAKHGFKPVWFTEEEIRQNLEREYKPE
jgi:acyl-homoserine-lactone acylase